VLGLVSALLVSGCSDEPVPKVAPPSASPSASSTPASSEPKLNPVETVRAWVDAQNEAMLTGDTGDMRDLSAPDCKSCDWSAEPIEKVFAAGGYFHTKGWLINAAKLANADGRHAKVNAAVTVRGGSTLNAKGEDPVVYAADKRIVVFKLTRSDEQWAISFIGFLS
jgi:hypothetical protein